MHIREYIKKLGDEVCAKRWDNMRFQQVRLWRLGLLPVSRKKGTRIIEIEKGLLTYADVFGPLPSTVKEQDLKKPKHITAKKKAEKAAKSKSEG